MCFLAEFPLSKGRMICPEGSVAVEDGEWLGRADVVEMG